MNNRMHAKMKNFRWFSKILVANVSRMCISRITTAVRISMLTEMNTENNHLYKELIDESKELQVKQVPMIVIITENLIITFPWCQIIPLIFISLLLPTTELLRFFSIAILKRTRDIMVNITRLIPKWKLIPFIVVDWGAVTKSLFIYPVGA